MMRLTTLFVAAAILVAGAPLQTRGETAKTIVEKAIEAHGGMENLKKYPGSKSTMKGTMSLMGQEIAIDGENTSFLPDLAKNVLHMNIGQKLTIVQIWNGGKFQMTVNGAAPPISDRVKADISDALFVSDALHLFPLIEDKAYDLSVIENPGKFGGKEVVGITIKKKGHKDIKLYFDATTHVIAGYDRKGLDPAENEVDQQTIVSESKKIDGLLTPIKMEILNDGKKFMSIEITDVKYLQEIDRKIFDIAD